MYHIPAEVDEPEDDRLNTTDELKMSGARLTFLHQKYDEAGRDLAHCKDDADSDQCIDATCSPTNNHSLVLYPVYVTSLL